MQAIGAGTAGSDETGRRALRRLTWMVLACLGCAILIALVLVAAAVQAVSAIDGEAKARERTQVERFVWAEGGKLDYVTLGAMQQTLDLTATRLTTPEAVHASEISVTFVDGRVVAWMPHLFGAETFARMAPLRIVLAIAFVTLVAIIALNVRRAGRALDTRRQEATRLALTDPLTGIGNRLAFEAALGARLSTGVPFALVLADLDRFKPINDAYGHAAGDRVLRHVALALQQSGADTAARLGGDEFGMLCAAEMVEPVLAAIEAAIAIPLKFEGHAIGAAISFGVAFSTETAPEREALMRAADAALYRAKGRGRESRRAA